MASPGRYRPAPPDVPLQTRVAPPGLPKLPAPGLAPVAAPSFHAGYAYPPYAHPHLPQPPPPPPQPSYQHPPFHERPPPSYGYGAPYHQTPYTHPPPSQHPHPQAHSHPQPQSQPPPPASSSSSSHSLSQPRLHPPPSAPLNHRPAPPPLTQPSRGSDASLEPPAPAQWDAPFQQALAPLSRVDESTRRRYQLDVVQQPQRARMCGFGDKDRRPITPPPCVRLIITDITTGKEVDCNDVDHTMFVLNVDLWDVKGENEVNLVRSSQGSSSISVTTSLSYSTPSSGESSAASYTHPGLPPGRDQPYTPTQAMGYGSEYQGPQPGYALGSPSYPHNGTFGPPTQYFPHQQSYRPEQAMGGMPSQGGIVPYGRNGSISEFGQDQVSHGRVSVFGTAPTGMFSRNLIGSLAASAFRLSDDNDKVGIWFVLQDLSVRTEGSFRLRFSFVNVGPRPGPSREENAPKVNTGRAPILASAFSNIFTVYSAKKFPGVCESTPLSKTFAIQGIKIPIRKDANIKGEDGGEDDDY